ncbi:MAG: ABC transporter ATP-binding protein [Oscillospiraceae bacterium]
MIKIKDYIKKFDEYKAVDGLNLTISKGSIYGLVGTNGSGKSTLLRSICGVYKPTWGDIEVDGEKVYENVLAKSKVFFVSDDMYFPENATINSVANFYKTIYPKWSNEIYLNLVAKFPLDPNKRIKTFSKGMHRQAALIIALSCQPDYMLLDEAFDGLDPVIRVAVRKLIADEVASREMTVVIASHNLRELEDLCDSIGILHKGKLVIEQSMESINESFCKMQAVFKPMVEKEKLLGDNILSVDIKGSMAVIVAKSSQAELKEKISSLNPMLAEYMPLSLEEVFVYEMEASGYDYNNILF